MHVKLHRTCNPHSPASSPEFYEAMLRSSLVELKSMVLTLMNQTFFLAALIDVSHMESKIDLGNLRASINILLDVIAKKELFRASFSPNSRKTK